MATRASSYFRSLGDVLLSMQASGDDGAPVALDEATEAAAARIVRAKRGGKKVLVVGNGGSAAIASHVHNDLCKSVGVRSLVFTEQPLLTALANDLSYAAAYEFATGLWGDADDLLIAISSGGRSENILRAVAQARSCKMGVLTLSGFGADNPLRRLGDINLYANATAYGPVELAHSCVLHYLTDRATEMLASDGSSKKG